MSHFAIYYLPDDSPTPAPPTDPNTLERYRLSALALLPRGTAFVLQALTGVSDFLEGAVEEFARIDAAAHKLLDSSLPIDSDTAYLDDWERVLGLPAGLGSTAERQLAAAAALAHDARNHREAYEDAIEAAGFTLDDVLYFAPFEAGVSAAGDPVLDDDWLYTATLVIGGTSGPEDLVELAALLRAQLQRAHTHLILSAV